MTTGRISAPVPARFHGRVVLLTAGGGSIGAATARRLAREGAGTIVLVDRSDHVHDVADEVRHIGACAEALQLDCTDEAAVEVALGGVLSRQVRVDVLVNGVGGGGGGQNTKFVDSSSAMWRRIIETTLVSAMIVTRQLLPGMHARRYGRIVNIGSSIALLPTPMMTEYAAAKAGIIGFTRGLALETAAHGITVNTVSPGPVESGATAKLAPDVLARSVNAVPMGRIGQPEDIAAAVAFLGSDDAAFITGQNLAVNGGRALN